MLTSNFEKIAPVSFEQFLFHLNCQYLNLEKWIGTIGTTKEIIEKFKPQKLRNSRYKMYNIKTLQLTYILLSLLSVFSCEWRVEDQPGY